MGTVAFAALHACTTPCAPQYDNQAVLLAQTETELREARISAAGSGSGVEGGSKGATGASSLQGLKKSLVKMEQERNALK